MKIKTLVAASLLAAAGVVGGVSQSASACGISLDVNNNLNTDVDVNWTLSKVRAAPLGIPGTWTSLGNTTVNLDADTGGSGDELTKALNLAFSCGTARQYRLYVTDGNGNSWYEYHNEVGPSGLWTTNVNPYIDIE